MAIAPSDSYVPGPIQTYACTVLLLGKPVPCNALDLLFIATRPSRLVDLTAADLRRWIRTAVTSVIADAAFSSDSGGTQQCRTSDICAKTTLRYRTS